MPTKRATPVVIETPFPSVEQVVRTLRHFDEVMNPSKPAFTLRNPTSAEDLARHKARVQAWESKLAREAKKTAAVHRYHALTKWLRDQKKSPLPVCFEDLEDEDKGIGMVLPYTAWDRDWWTNERDPEHSQSRAWLDAGWKVQSVDPGREVVVFVRSSGT